MQTALQSKYQREREAAAKAKAHVEALKKTQELSRDEAARLHEEAFNDFLEGREPAGAAKSHAKPAAAAKEDKK